MVKSINVDFPDNFTPPEKFYSPLCRECPFFWAECYDPIIGCTLIEYESNKIKKLYESTKNDTILKYLSTKCPIRKYFE